jgi:hypothetical protein
LDHSAPSSPIGEPNALYSSHAVYETPHGGYFVYRGNGHPYTYTYGPGGLAGLFHNKYALACALFASIGGLLFGYDQGVIANVLVMKDFTGRWPIGAWEKGLMSKDITLSAEVYSDWKLYSCHARTRVPFRRSYDWHICRSLYTQTSHHHGLEYVLTANHPNLLANFYTPVIFILGSTFQFAAQVLPHIIIGRAIGGLGVGALRCAGQSIC